MGLTYGGEIGLGACLPIIGLSIGPATLELQAQLAAALQLQASLNVAPPSVSAQIAFLTAFLAELNASVNLGLPSVSFNLSACATLITNLNVQLGLLVQLQALLAAVGVFGYVYTGRADGLGPALTTELTGGWRDGSGAAATSTAIILGTVTSPTATALTTLFSGV